MKGWPPLYSELASLQDGPFAELCCARGSSAKQSSQHRANGYSGRWLSTCRGVKCFLAA